MEAKFQQVNMDDYDPDDIWRIGNNFIEIADLPDKSENVFIEPICFSAEQMRLNFIAEKEKLQSAESNMLAPYTQALTPKLAKIHEQGYKLQSKYAKMYRSLINKHFDIILINMEFLSENVAFGFCQSALIALFKDHKGMISDEQLAILYSLQPSKQ
jgi:hypothetical protein